MTVSRVEHEKVRDGEDVLIPLTEESDDDWSIHISNSSYIVTFSKVTRMDSGGLHCWSDGSVRMFVAEDDGFVPEGIREKLIGIAEYTG